MQHWGSLYWYSVIKLILMLNIDSVRQYSPKWLDTNQSMQSRDRREHTGEDRWTVEKQSPCEPSVRFYISLMQIIINCLFNKRHETFKMEKDVRSIWVVVKVDLPAANSLTCKIIFYMYTLNISDRMKTLCPWWSTGRGGASPLQTTHQQLPVVAVTH